MSLRPAPEPATKLGRYRQLSPLAGIRVSPIALGAMSIGDKWEAAGFGAMNKESSYKLLDAYYEAGGNFIDTANSYQDESSEQIIGEWMEERGNRDEIVLATKYTLPFTRNPKQQINYTGNHPKSLHISVEASLKKLRTSYIDILYVHAWDWNSSVEEVMDHLHHLVASRKVLYLGISDAPAWVVAKANTYARMAHKTPFVIYQGKWSILDRDFEREILPMALSEGLAIAPWGVLAGGKIRTDEEEERRRATGEKGRTIFNPQWERTDDEKKICKALEVVQKQVGAKSIQAVATAYILQKQPYVFPILGGRKVEQLQENIEALDVALTEEHIKYLEGILPFDVGFPISFIGNGTKASPWFTTAGAIDLWPTAPALRPQT